MASTTENPVSDPSTHDNPSTSTVDTSNIPEVVKDEEARKAAVRGVNPLTGAAAGVVEAVASDESLSAVALALRTSPPGVFHPLSADLRSVEASVTAAKVLVDTFLAHGICMDVMDPAAFNKQQREARGEPEPKDDSGTPSTSSSRTRSSSS